ncbi:Adenylyl-sulfate kinase [Folsomia candida]|uniref:Adenylyl-sulfate kinase n=1 Tax=Folsomia candida TaxID=158441 RepID=A0A226F5G9_FOLCA|nr:Adenylyl-sulfate kinase [Folsomia candida]
MDLSTPTSSKITHVGSPSPSPPSNKRMKWQSESEVNNGCTILMTGLAKSGKTTISNALTKMLKSNGILVKQIDGKSLRAGLCKNLNFDEDKDRSAFVHLASEHAKGITEEGFVSIISIVAPLHEDRQKARDSHEQDGLKFVDVFVDRSRAECDAETGLRRNVINPIDADYEPPTNPDVHLKRIGNNVDELTRHLVSRLVGYSPFSPSISSPRSTVPSPFTATPSPSSTTYSSDSDLGVGEFDDERDSVTKFKLPRKSDIRTIFDYVKSVLVQRGFVGKDEEIDKDPLFFVLIEEWTTHYNTHKAGMEKFFPVKIPISTRGKTQTKGAKTPQKNDVGENEWGEFIPLYWNGSTLCYGSIHQGVPHLKKCKQCWSRSTSEGYLCNNHSTNRYQNFAVLRDINEKTIHYHAALSIMSVKKTEWTTNMVKKSAYNINLTQKYLAAHPNAHFTPIYEKSILLSSPERLPAIHSMTLSVALITLFRNMEKIDSDAPIKPHSFLHKQLYMDNANLAAVEKILEENGVTFTVGNDDDDSSSSLINKDRYCSKLPRIYCGVEPNNKVNVGLKTSRRREEEDHSVYTHSDQFKSGPIYQTPLSDEQLAIANTIETSNSFKQWTDQQRDLFDLVKEDCTRKEGLGHAALVLAEMKGQSYNGILIQRDNKKYEN